MADTTTELEVLDQIVGVLGGQSGQHETVVPVLEDIRDLLGGGGGGGSYNPSLSVGRADALTGADSTAQWAQRESTGSGAATVRSVQGAAVAWNQNVHNNNTGAEVTGITFTNNGDGSWTVDGTASAETFRYADNPQLQDLIVGHKYLAKGCPAGGSASTYLYRDSWWHTFIDYGDGAIFTVAEGRQACTPSIVIANGATVNNLVFRPQLFDLTAMFGSGNEPSTVAEFEAMYPAAYYPYSAPTLKPVRIAGIRSTDAQGGELDSVEWTAQTLRAAGSVRDELTADELVTRVGVTTVTGANYWNAGSAAYNGDLATDRYVIINGAIPDGAAPHPINVRVTDFTTVSNPSVGIWETPDSHVNECRMNGTQLHICFSNALVGITTDMTAAQRTEAIKTWLNAHPQEVWYELATPTTQPISPALPMTYKVQAGGSESIIVPDGEVSAAPIITVAEGESAADLVMDALAAIAAPDGPTATSNHAINTYLTMQGKLYKVTSAIAVGESITPNTNVSQTTVMAELIARTA